MAVGTPAPYSEWLRFHKIPRRVWTGPDLDDRLEVMAATSTTSKRNRRVGRRGLFAGVLLAGLLLVGAPAGADTYGNGQGNNTGQGSDPGSSTTTQVTTTTVATTTTVGNGSNGSNGSTGGDSGTNGNSGNLAFTGTDALTLAIIGAGATGAGLVLVASTRKRRRAEV